VIGHTCRSLKCRHKVQYINRTRLPRNATTLINWGGLSKEDKNQRTEEQGKHALSATFLPVTGREKCNAPVSFSVWGPGG